MEERVIIYNVFAQLTESFLINQRGTWKNNEKNFHAYKLQRWKYLFLEVLLL